MRQGDDVVLDAIATTGTFSVLRERLPEPGKSLRLGGAVGSLGRAVVAALIRHTPERIFVLVARDPQQATAMEADVEALLGPDASVLYRQRGILAVRER